MRIVASSTVRSFFKKFDKISAHAFKQINIIRTEHFLKVLNFVFLLVYNIDYLKKIIQNMLNQCLIIKQQFLVCASYFIFSESIL